MRALLRRQVLIWLVLALVVLYGAYSLTENLNIARLQEKVTQVIHFNYDSGFYDHSLHLRLHRDFEVPLWGRIYYTLDGNDPNPTTGQRYHWGLTLDLPEDNLQVYPLKVSLCYPDGQCSQPLMRTYVLGRQLTDDVSLSLISLTSDHEGLYGYERGIMVRGKIYDDNVAAGDSENGNSHERGPEWIRDAQLTMFTTNGEVLLEQAVGIGISGDSSAGFPVKSFKVYGNPKYGYTPLNFSFYAPGTCASWSLVGRYNTLRLRSGSQDLYNGNIRASVASQLVTEAGFDGITASQRALLYLNGEFYGIFDVQQPYSNSFLARKFGLPDSDGVQTAKGSEQHVFTALEVDSYFSGNLNELDSRLQLENHVDMDNYLTYYALNILMKNVDWGHKNYEGWRYTGRRDTDNPYTDGRVRFLIYDLDYIYSPVGIPLNDHSSGNDTWDNLYEALPAFQSGTFPHVLESTYYRDRFLTILQDLLAGPFVPEHVQETIIAQQQVIEPAVGQFYDDDLTTKFYDGIATMSAVVNTIPDLMHERVERYLDLSDLYSLTINTDVGATVSWVGHTLAPNASYHNNYYQGTSLELKATPLAGYHFDHWLINGEVTSDSTLVLTSDQTATSEPLVVEAVTVPTSDEVLRFQQVAYSDDDHCLELSNRGHQPLNLSHYSLSLEENWPTTCLLPDVELPPGETFRLRTSDSWSFERLYTCNLNLEAGRWVWLFRQGEVHDIAALPRLEPGESYCYDWSRQQWQHCLQSYNNLEPPD